MAVFANLPFEYTLEHTLEHTLKHTHHQHTINIPLNTPSASPINTLLTPSFKKNLNIPSNTSFYTPLTIPFYPPSTPLLHRSAAGGDDKEGSSKPKVAIQWVPAATSVVAEVRMYGSLFNVEEPSDTAWESELNPESEVVLKQGEYSCSIYPPQMTPLQMTPNLTSPNLSLTTPTLTIPTTLDQQRVLTPPYETGSPKQRCTSNLNDWVFSW